jgi:hypothetical protein
MSEVFLDLLEDNGIIIKLSPPHTPQVNGCAECFMRTMMDKAEAMHHMACLPKSYWEFAVEQAVHMYNLSPMFHLKWKTPIEITNKKVPSIKDLRVFGCGAYVFILADIQKDNLDAKAELMVYLGHGPSGHHFMHFNGSVFHSSNATFDEEHFPRCSTSKPTKPQPVKGGPPTGLSRARASSLKSHGSAAAGAAGTVGTAGTEGMAWAVMNSSDGWALALSSVVLVAEDSAAESDSAVSSGMGSQKHWRLELEATGDE